MVKNEIGAESLSSPKSMDILIEPRWISGPNLVIPASLGEKLSCGQTQNRINLDI